MHSEPSQTSKMKSFANMAEYLPHLKVNYQKQRTSKESMKMIIRHFKLNLLPVQNPAVTYEMYYYYIFEQEVNFILSKAENVQNRNF